jgi:hypothetical protein
MKRLNHKWIIPFLLFALTILVSCIPVATGEPSQEPPVPSSTTTQTDLPIISETAQPSLTITSTGSPTASQTMQLTQTFIPIVSPIVSKPPRPTRTFTPTASPTITATVQPTETAEPSATYCPQATAEPFWVDPVTSPTDQLSQVIAVHIGKGEEVTVVTESGTFTVTGDFSYHSNPALVEISLLPNTVHHLEVTAKVGRGPGSSPVENCIYGGYTLRATTDDQGAPLTIVQGAPTP